MISLSTILKHYKRLEIQKEIIINAKDREVIARFNDKFSSRPDVLHYPTDILELAKNGATSFHASEERWRNPLHLSPEMSRKDLENLRMGWDLVIDIDCPYWQYSKLITHLIVKALRKHGMNSISVKFSGNKGFHIGIPFEAFPKKVNNIDIRLLFPDGVRRIAAYLSYYIDSKETNYELTKNILSKKSIKDLAKELDINIKNLTKKVCEKCDKVISEKESDVINIECPYCNASYKIKDDTRFLKCEKCKKLIKFDQAETKDICPFCKGKKFIEKFDSSKILKIDAVLISSRHLFRTPYSLHEKSSLCSIPIDPNKILEFDKNFAKPENIKISSFRFLDRKYAKENEANQLIIQAFDFDLKKEEKVQLKKEFEMPKSALPEQFFPPCIKKILNGIVDGRKRSLFVLINFLTSVGWDYNKIEKLLKEWNKKNAEPLREVYLKGQLRYHKQHKKRILPPNCSNSMYFKDMQMCLPDNLCEKIKNPVNYALRKVRYIKKRIIPKLVDTQT